jgi:hypothetical protein
MKLASVDATERTKKSLFVQSVCRKHHYHSGSSLPQLAAGEAIGNRISGSLLPRLCGGEGLGMRGPARAGYPANRRTEPTAQKPLTPSPSPRSGARGARYFSLRVSCDLATMRQTRPSRMTGTETSPLCHVVRRRRHEKTFRGSSARTTGDAGKKNARHAPRRSPPFLHEPKALASGLSSWLASLSTPAASAVGSVFARPPARRELEWGRSYSEPPPFFRSKRTFRTPPTVGRPCRFRPCWATLQRQQNYRREPDRQPLPP